MEGDGVDKSMPPKGVGQTNGARSPAVSSNREQPRLGVSMLGVIPPAGVSSHRLGVTPDVPAGVWSHRDSVRADCGVLSQREHLRSLVLLQEFDPNAKGSGLAFSTEAARMTQVPKQTIGGLTGNGRVQIADTM